MIHVSLDPGRTARPLGASEPRTVRLFHVSGRHVFHALRSTRPCLEHPPVASVHQSRDASPTRMAYVYASPTHPPAPLLGHVVALALPASTSSLQSTGCISARGFTGAPASTASNASILQCAVAVTSAKATGRHRIISDMTCSLPSVNDYATAWLLNGQQPHSLAYPCVMAMLKDVPQGFWLTGADSSLRQSTTGGTGTPPYLCTQGEGGLLVETPHARAPGMTGKARREHDGARPVLQ